jgi:hypothetical protein
LSYGLLKLADGFQLVFAEKTQFVGLDVGGAFGFVPPSGLGLVVRALGENDVVFADLFFNQALRIGRYLLATDD